MCGRFTLTVDPAELQDTFSNYTFPSRFAPRFNIAPSQPVLAIPNDGTNTADFFIWGLIPMWAKDPSIGTRLINARGFHRIRMAIDSVGYDLLLNEWPQVVRNGTGATKSLQGGAEDYLHEAALANSPASSTFYDPECDGSAMASLGVHEHWNNPVDRQYSRNLGQTNGIELIYAKLTNFAPRLTLRPSGTGFNISWPSSKVGYRLQSTALLSSPLDWITITNRPSFFQAQWVVSNSFGGSNRFYRLMK